MTEPSPCGLNCARYGTLDLEGFQIGVCTVDVQSVQRSVVINGPMPCNGEHYVRKSIYPSTVIEVIRKGYKR